MLLRGGSGPPRPPGSQPLARAAERLRSEGIEVLFGEGLAPEQGWLVPRAGRWEPVAAPRSGTRRIDAVYDRFPSQSWPAPWEATWRGLSTDAPFGNGPAVTRLARDKVATQRAWQAAGLALPALELDPARFEGRLRAWGAGFLKPRHGALGRGVRFVRPGDALPARGPGARRGHDDQLVLQRAVEPPAGYQGVSIRQLVQRDLSGGWALPPAAARCSGMDRVVNAARGAHVCPAAELLPEERLADLQQRARAAADTLAATTGELVLEVGLDFVCDRDWRPWLIEANGRPRGRLGALAEQWPARFGAVREALNERPLRVLAALARDRRTPPRPS